MKKPKDTHRIKIELEFDSRRDFLALKGAVSRSLREALGSFGSYLPLRRLLDKIEKQADEQEWEKLWKDPTP
jgi:hypothetical protein